MFSSGHFVCVRYSTECGIASSARPDVCSWYFSDMPRQPDDVRSRGDSVAKVFWGDDQNFSGPLMPFARGDMRDHIVSHKNDHGASYGRYAVLQRRSKSAFAGFSASFNFRLLQHNRGQSRHPAARRRLPLVVDHQRSRDGCWYLATGTPSRNSCPTGSNAKERCSGSKCHSIKC